MRRFLTYAFSLVLVAAVALWAFDSLCVALVKQSQGTSMYKMYRLFGNHPSDEIPIFGSSRAASNFVPSLISPNAFCYGVDGCAMDETFFQVESYLERNPTGMPIIINFDPWGFPYAPYRADYTLASIPQLPTPNPQPSTILGIRMIGKLRSIVAAWLNERMAGTKRIDNGAVMQLVSRTPAEWKVINSTIPQWHFEITEAWRKRVSKLCKGSQRQIIWVVSPCSPEWKRQYSDRPVSVRFLDELKSLPNSRVIDLYKLDYDESLFMDAAHLNAKGAELFTKHLVKEMGVM